MSGSSNPNLDFGRGVDDMMELYDFLDAGGDSLLGILESGAPQEPRERGLSMSLEQQHHQPALRPASMVSPAVAASPRRSPSFGAPLLPVLNSVPAIHPFAAAHHQLTSGGQRPAFLPAGEAVAVRPSGKQSHLALQAPLAPHAGELGGLRGSTLHDWQPDLFAEGSSGRSGRGGGGGSSAPALRRDRRPSARLYAAAEEMSGSSTALLGALTSGSAARRVRRTFSSGGRGGGGVGVDLGGSGGLIFGQGAHDSGSGAVGGDGDVDDDAAEPYPDDQEQQFAVSMLATVRRGRGGGSGALPPGIAADAYLPPSAGIGDGHGGSEDGGGPAPQAPPARAPPGRRKRFLWSELLHKQFTACIFDFGLKTVTPRLLFEQMQPGPREMTSDHIKSHLQKYRLNVKAGREAFATLYNQALAEATAAAEAAAAATGSPPYPVQFSTYPIAIVTRPDPTGYSDSAAVLVRDVPASRPGAPCPRCEVVDRLSALGVGYLLDDEGEPISTRAAAAGVPPLAEDEGGVSAGPLLLGGLEASAAFSRAAPDHEDGMGLDAASGPRDRRRAPSIAPAPAAVDPAVSAALAALLPSHAAREEVLALSPPTLALLAPVFLAAVAAATADRAGAAVPGTAAAVALPPLRAAAEVVAPEAASAAVAAAPAAAPLPVRPVVTFAPEPTRVDAPAAAAPAPPEASSSLNRRQAALAIDMSKHMTWHRKMRERQEGQMLAYGSGTGDGASLLGGERGSEADGGDVTPTTRLVMAEMMALGQQPVPTAAAAAAARPAEAGAAGGSDAADPVRHFTASAAAESVTPLAVPFAPVGAGLNLVAAGLVAAAAARGAVPATAAAPGALAASTSAGDALGVAVPESGHAGRSPAAAAAAAPLPRGMRDDATAISALLSFERRPQAASDAGVGADLQYDPAAAGAAGSAPNGSNQSNSSGSVAGSEAAAAAADEAGRRMPPSSRPMPASLRNATAEGGAGNGGGGARDGGDDQSTLDDVLTALQLPLGARDRESVAVTLARIDALLSIDTGEDAAGAAGAAADARDLASRGGSGGVVVQKSAAFFEAMAAVRQVPVGPGVTPSVLLSFLNMAASDAAEQ